MNDVVITPANSILAFTSSNGEIVSLFLTESAGNPLLVLDGTNSPLFHFSGSAIFVDGLSGSLSQLSDGSPFIEGQGTVTVTTASDGHIIVSGTGDGGSGGGSGVTTTNQIYTPDLVTSATAWYDSFYGTGSLGGKWADWDPDGIMQVITDFNAGLVLSSSNASGVCSGIFQAAPSGSFMVTGKVSAEAPLQTGNFFNAGVFFGGDLYSNPTTDPIRTSSIFDNGNTTGFSTQIWTDYNSYSSEITDVDTVGPMSGYVRVYYDSGSGNWQAAWSYNGVGWRVYRNATAAGATPSTVGFYISINSATPHRGIIEWFDVTEGTQRITDPIQGKMVKYVEA